LEIEKPWGREGERDVEVLAVEQLAAALGDPRGAGGALALGAVAVAAGAVVDAAVAAAVAFVDLAAEGGRAALRQGRRNAFLQRGQRPAPSGRRG